MRTALGERLRDLARFHQVLCVTHLAQVAAFADAHVHVGKRVVDGRTMAEATVLDRRRAGDRAGRHAGRRRGRRRGASGGGRVAACRGRVTSPDPALTEAIDAFLLELQVERGLSPLTIAAYRRDLGQFAAVAGSSWRADPEPVRSFVNGLRRDGLRPTTQARKVAAIRSFYGFALREGIAQRDVAALLDSPRPGSYLPDVLDPDEVERILDAPPDDPVGIRDAAILELLYACGLRVSELTGLDTDRLDLDGAAGPRHREGQPGAAGADGGAGAGADASVPERSARDLDGRQADAGGLREPARPTAGARIGLAHGAALDGSGRAWWGTSRRTRFGTASRPICSRAAPICGWSRRSLAMLASAPPSSTRT